MYRMARNGRHLRESPEWLFLTPPGREVSGPGGVSRGLATLLIGVHLSLIACCMIALALPSKPRKLKRILGGILFLLYFPWISPVLAPLTTSLLLQPIVDQRFAAFSLGARGASTAQGSSLRSLGRSTGSLTASLPPSREIWRQSGSSSASSSAMTSSMVSSSTS